MNTDGGGAQPAEQRPFNEFGFKEIADAALRISDLPQADTIDWLTISGFALSYDAYEYWGSFEKCADIANASLARWRKTGELPEALTELRTCLFFEQRRWRHFGEQPDKEAMVYILATLAALRRTLMTTDGR